MSAGLAGLTEISTAEAAQKLNAFGDGVRERLNALTAKRGLPMQFTGIGSMIHVHMRGGDIRSPADAASGDPKLRDLFFFGLLERGCRPPKRGLLTLSLAVNLEP